MYSLSQHIQFNIKMFGNKCCHCEVGPQYHIVPYYCILQYHITVYYSTILLHILFKAALTKFLKLCINSVSSSLNINSNSRSCNIPEDLLLPVLDIDGAL